MNTDYPFHKFANLFPMMQDEEHKSLVKSIREHGLKEKIWLFKGEILDGRNRYLACKEAGVTPQFREYQGTEEQALNDVLSWNLERRHLNQGQKAFIALQILPEFERIAKEKQLAQAENGAKGAEFGSLGGRGNKNPLVVNSPQGGLEKTILSVPEIGGGGGDHADRVYPRTWLGHHDHTGGEAQLLS